MILISYYLLNVMNIIRHVFHVEGSEVLILIYYLLRVMMLLNYNLLRVSNNTIWMFHIEK